MKSKLLNVSIIVGSLSMLLFLVAAKGNNTKSKLGYINVAQLWKELPEKQQADSVLLKMKGEFLSYYEQKQKAFETEVMTFKRDSANMTELIKKEKLENLLKEQEALKKFPEQADAELNKKKDELYNPIRVKMQKAIDEVAAANNFDYITDVSIGHIVYARNPEDNILPLVKKKMGLK